MHGSRGLNAREHSRSCGRLRCAVVGCHLADGSGREMVISKRLSILGRRVLCRSNPRIRGALRSALAFDPSGSSRVVRRVAFGDLDDELSLWEERDQLLARLLECKTFKDAAQVLDRMARRAALSTPRRVGPGDEFASIAPDILAGVTPQREF